MQIELSVIKLELQRILGDTLHITPIAAGTINRSFCVQHGDQRYFLKIFDRKTASRLDRVKLFMQQQQLACQGIAPKPVYLSTHQTFQLDSWINGENLRSCPENSAEKCRILARVMSQIHGLDVALPPLDLAADWHYYLSVSEKRISPEERSELALMLNYWQQESLSESVCCHNDLAFEHINAFPHVLVFDWEYSATGSPYFDLASCITINQLSSAEQRIFLAHYADLRNINEKTAMDKVQKMLAVVHKTNELWALAFVN